MVKEGKIIGKNTQAIIEKLLKKGTHPLANLRKIQGIISLKNNYDIDALECGCEMALESNKLFYLFIKNCSENFNHIKNTTDGSSRFAVGS